MASRGPRAGSACCAWRPVCWPSAARWRSRWCGGRADCGCGGWGCWRWSVLTAALVYVQMVLGALVRHTHSSAWGRGHLLIAFAVVAAGVLLLKRIFDTPGRQRVVGRTALLLAVLLTVQVLLGVEAW